MLFNYDFKENGFDHIEDYGYNVPDKDCAKAIANIMWERKMQFIKEKNSQLVLDKTSYCMGIINFILQAETTKLDEAIEEEFYDELKDYFEDEAREQYNND